MRIVLEKEAYADFEKAAKAKNMTTRELGAEIIKSSLEKQ